MIYASIDTETTGLDVYSCDLIEVGIVVDNLKDPKPLNELPTWHTYVRSPNNIYRGEPFALHMHSEIFKRIANQAQPFTYLEPQEVGKEMARFLSPYFEGKIIAAGKNFGSFDKPILERLPGFEGEVSFGHRSIDPAILYWKPLEDEKIPNLKTCLERAGITKEVQHTALEDAFDVVKLIRVAAFGTVDPNQ